MRGGGVSKNNLCCLAAAALQGRICVVVVCVVVCCVFVLVEICLTSEDRRVDTLPFSVSGASRMELINAKLFVCLLRKRLDVIT